MADATLKSNPPQWTDRKYVNLQVQQLKLNRAPYEPQMREIADYFLSYRLRLTTSDYNRGNRLNERIYDTVAPLAVSTLENGFMSAASDPATRWVNFSTKDPDRANYGPHKVWLDYVTDVCLEIMADSRMYVDTPTCYGNMAAFGTCAMSIEESFKRSLIHTRVHPTGSYWISQDDEGNVDTFYREIRMSVAQIYKKFGPEADYSNHLQNLIDSQRWEQWVDIGHLIQPNLEDSPSNVFSISKPWVSWWFELGTSSQQGAYGYFDSITNENRFLRKSGYDEFPVMVGRWDLTDGDTYAIDCPGMTVLGDVKTLNSYEKRSGQGIEKIVNPHWLAPIQLQGQADHGFIPGLTTYLPIAGDQAAVRPAHMVPPGFLDPVTKKEEWLRSHVNAAFYVDLFQLFDSLPDKERTATEIMQRKSEKLTKLGKPYANLQIGFFRPAMHRIFNIARRRGRIPPAPPDLQGHELSLVYNGILAQAQKLTRANPIERFANTMNAMAQANPNDQTLWDNVNRDRMLDQYADSLQVPADIIRSPQEVAQIRAQRQQQQMQQLKMQQLEQAGNAAHKLANSPTNGKNALTDLMRAHQIASSAA